MSGTDVHELRFGWNLADIDRLARIAVSSSWGSGWSRSELYEAAWPAIAEAIYSAPDDSPPTARELIWAGQDAMSVQVREDLHAHGYDRHGPGQFMARFDAYWAGSAHAGSPEPGIVERVALWQIWPCLTGRQRDALLAVATAGTYQGAAASLGIAQKSLQNNLLSARRRFLEMWHEHETPSGFWGSNRLVYRAADAAPVSQTGRKAMKAVRHRKPAAPKPEREIRHGTANAYNVWRCRCVPCAAVKRRESEQRRRNEGIAPRRFVTESQFAGILTRRAARETWASIAADLGFSEGHLRSLVRGTATPVPDDPAQARERRKAAA